MLFVMLALFLTGSTPRSLQIDEAVPYENALQAIPLFSTHSLEHASKDTLLICSACPDLRS